MYYINFKSVMIFGIELYKFLKHKFADLLCLLKKENNKILFDFIDKHFIL